MRLSKKVIAVLCAAFMVAVVAGCGGDDGGGSGGGGSATGVTDTSVKFGGTSAVTGPFASACVAETAGAQAWLDKVNDEGGVAGRTIDWELLDDAADPARAVTNAQRLVTKDQVFGMFNGCGSATSAAILPLVDQQKLPYVFPNALSSALLRPPHESVFTIVPLYSQQLPAALNYAFDQDGPGKVAIVYIDGLDDEMVPAVKSVTEEAGGEMVADIPIAVDATDFGSTVIKLKNADPDYLAFGTSTPQAGELVAQMARQGYSPKHLIGMQSLADPIYTETAGPAARDVTLAASPVITPTSPDAEECNATLPSGTDPSMYTLIGCASAKLLVSALETTGDDLTRESLIETLQGFDKVESGVSPPSTFHSSGLMVSDVNMLHLKKDGEFEQVAQVPIPNADE